ncbi:hypothetical protein HanIR_Chr11g0515251 [Helianthus annuus]|nr:hypothetical protein HanIR_Chr11g0515251 [Helianthus annuus]
MAEETLNTTAAVAESTAVTAEVSWLQRWRRLKKLRRWFVKRMDRRRRSLNRHRLRRNRMLPVSFLIRKRKC